MRVKRLASVAGFIVPYAVALLSRSKRATNVREDQRGDDGPGASGSALKAEVAGLKLEEYKFLRQEHEQNRRFVFERPLAIVAATLAVAFSQSDKVQLGFFPVVFLTVLAFNLWFTKNRMESSARIVAYIQLVLEPTATLRWIGWESSLRAYRNQNHVLNIPPDRRGSQSMAFYAPIFYFHLFLGLLVTTILLIQTEPLNSWVQSGVWKPFNGHSLQYVTLFVNLAALVIYFCAAIWFKPSNVRPLIEWNYSEWQKLLDHDGYCP